MVVGQFETRSCPRIPGSGRLAPRALSLLTRFNLAAAMKQPPCRREDAMLQILAVASVPPSAWGAAPGTETCLLCIPGLRVNALLGVIQRGSPVGTGDRPAG